MIPRLLLATALAVHAPSALAGDSGISPGASTVLGTLAGQAVGGFAGWSISAAMCWRYGSDAPAICLDQLDPAWGYGLPTGIAVGGFVGATLGHHLARGEQTRRVALATGITAAVATLLIYSPEYSHESGGYLPWLAGLGVAVFGMPIVAAVFAAPPHMAITPISGPGRLGTQVHVVF
ncbi:MAG: hypothetical protein JRI25_17525 [Deltaproteobacteria bacterium]|nr:hypothetical protein [Deltaproteobacteria bacterium]